MFSRIKQPRRRPDCSYVHNNPINFYDPLGLSWWSNIWKGDYDSEATTWGGVAGQIGVGLIPIVGQIADARDTAANIRNVWKDPKSGAAWTGLGGAAVAWIPGIGDAAKGGLKGGKKALTEAGQHALKEAEQQTIQKGLKEGEQQLIHQGEKKVAQEAEKEVIEGVKDAKKWAPGDSPLNLTNRGTPPSDTTVRRREWKNEAENPTRTDYTPEDIVRMKEGKPPQRYNADKGGIESMERSHEPVPKREGGTETVPRWPKEHEAVDPHRYPGY